MSDERAAMVNDRKATYLDVCGLSDSGRGLCSVGFPESSLVGTFGDELKSLLNHLLLSHSLKLATLWSLDPVRGKLIRVASQGASGNRLGSPVCDYSKRICGVSVDNRDVTQISDVKQLSAECKCLSENLTGELRLGPMVSIPVLSSYNIQQVMFLANLFPQSLQACKKRSEYELLGEIVGARLEILLQDHCMRCANRVGIDMAGLPEHSPAIVYKTVAEAIKRAVCADHAGVYTETSEGKQIALEYRTGPRRSDEISAELEGLATECWQNNRERLAFRMGPGRTLSYRELLPTETTYDLESWLFVPMRDPKGQAKGVFYCTKKTQADAKAEFIPFAYEDVAVVEAVGQAFAAQLEILMAEQSRISSLDKLGHELVLPISACRAAIEKIEVECANQQVKLKYNYFSDAVFFCDVMNRLMTELDIVRKGARNIPLDPRSVRLHKDVIAPAIRFVEPALRKRHVNVGQIKYGSIIANIPELYLDPWLMTQVVFNLLDNAVKYCDKDSDAFAIEIEGTAAEGGYELTFRDYGIGIPEGYEERIFLQHARGPDAEQYHVTGEGFGLWIASEIVSRHGGSLFLRSQNDPTEFVVFLPDSLENHRPV